ncbi:22541_t:CDS:2 [Gigaspora margarita]|uniref:22541_t:CDS:1 n=1 Tax=Gigaspora margarita TaxID=4874 RepID=A0ABN7VT63_GIGMA|nr:22541_t:CDS:2 [Gigaspora margarita]
MDNNNAALLLQLLTNPNTLQQTLATIKKSQQQSSPTPEMTLPVPSNAIIGIFPCGSAQNPITKEEWRRRKKIKKPKIEKIFLNYYMIHIGPIENLHDQLNACCQKGKYASEQEQGIVQKVIEKEAHEKGIPASPKRKNITPPKIKRHQQLMQMIIMIFNNLHQIKVHLLNHLLKNTIEADTIEADDNDTQQYSGSQQ